MGPAPANFGEPGEPPPTFVTVIFSLYSTCRCAPIGLLHRRSVSARANAGRFWIEGAGNGCIKRVDAIAVGQSCIADGARQSALQSPPYFGLFWSLGLLLGYLVLDTSGVKSDVIFLFGNPDFR